ncbi:SWIM zinc finger family protein [Paenibacillus gansuensis]|uniref:SWIM zinc finger domain-containing protein n=1 Tax=Paenibacillus gansuensis TaxID=306542 RepID=A0ABW5P9S2_9BACL
MNLLLTLEDEEWNKLVEDTASMFDDLTLKRGYQYYKQGRAELIKMAGEKTVKAEVKGSEPYLVSVDLADLGQSYCECPVPRGCKHMVAVLLAIAEEQGRSVHQLANARSELALMQAKAAIKARQQQPAAEAAELTEAQIMLLPQMTVEERYAFIVKSTAHLPAHLSGLHYANAVMQTFEPARQRLDADEWLWLQIHLYLYLLQHLVRKRTEEHSYYFTSRGVYTDQSVSNMMELLQRKISDAQASALSAERRAMAIGTAAFVRQCAVTEPKDLRHFVKIYFSLWRHWFGAGTNDVAVHREEIEALERTAAHPTDAEEAGTGTQAVSAFNLQIALALQYYYIGNDDDCWEALREAGRAGSFSSDFLYYFLHRISENSEWERLFTWLKEFSPFFKGRPHSDMREYTAYWDLLIPALPSAEPVFWDILADMLPYSQHIYEEKLYEHGKWKAWMDFHLSIASDPLDFKVSELAPIEKDAPELLLPFYHQAVERYVILKNRQSYKAAVKMLKRLAKLYKKLKRTDRWELFLEGFTMRYSRLRALQEELKKGKLTE